MTGTRFALGPLEAVCGVGGAGALARRLGLSRSAVQRARVGGLGVVQADEWAVRAGFHPFDVWGAAWFELDDGAAGPAGVDQAAAEAVGEAEERREVFGQAGEEPAAVGVDPVWVRWRRSRLGFSVRGFAEELAGRGLRVSKSTVARWESGRSLPSAEQLEVLVEVLGPLGTGWPAEAYQAREATSRPGVRPVLRSRAPAAKLQVSTSGASGALESPSMV